MLECGFRVDFWCALPFIDDFDIVHTAMKIFCCLSVHYYVHQVKTVSHDTTQLVRLLRTVQALVTNPALHLDSKPYVSVIKHSFCLFESAWPTTFL